MSLKSIEQSSQARNGLEAIDYIYTVILNGQTRCRLTLLAYPRHLDNLIGKVFIQMSC